MQSGQGVSLSRPFAQQGFGVGVRLAGGRGGGEGLVFARQQQHCSESGELPQPQVPPEQADERPSGELLRSAEGAGAGKPMLAAR
jgi:hypothetical protein